MFDLGGDDDGWSTEGVQQPPTAITVPSTSTSSSSLPPPLPIPRVVTAQTAASLIGRIHASLSGYTYHATNQKGFRTTAFVAPFEKGVMDGHVDSRMGRGDLWGSDSCHCIQCEAVVIMRKAAAVMTINQNRSSSSSPKAATSLITSAPVVIVAVDLDNFGFNHFKQQFDKLVANTNKGGKRDRGDGNDGVDGDDVDLDVDELLSRCVFWCFHGACFSRQHKTSPQEFIKLSISEHQKRKSNSQMSVWDALIFRDRLPSSEAMTTSAGGGGSSDALGCSPHLHVTPCGGHSQAVDEVMLAAAWQMTGAAAAEDSASSTCASTGGVDAAVELPMVVLTGDKGLAEAVADACCKGGGGLNNVRTVCSNGPKMGGGRMILVWRELLRQVASL